MNSNLFKILIFILIACYPLFIFMGLKEVGVRFAGLVFTVLLVARVFMGMRSVSYFVLALLGFIPILYAIISNDVIGLKFYPVVISLSMLAMFSYSLYSPPTMVERIARLTEPDLPPSGVEYTRKVTIVWCIFFILNACCAFYTAMYSSMEIWTLYNGLVSYILMGCLMAVEWLVRLRVKSRG
jgi:uncharacterized membrane protein